MGLIELRYYIDSEGRKPLVEWLDSLPNKKARAQIRARLTRVAAGNFGDCKPLRDGVMELHIDLGPGYRVYLSRQGPLLVLLLYGSDKGKQD